MFKKLFLVLGLFFLASYSVIPLSAEEITFSDGNHYEGEVQAGVPHGNGTLTFPDGSKYEGEFVNGAWHGKGKLTAINGPLYQGEFLDGQFHGRGIVTFSDGTYCSGDFAFNRVVWAFGKSRDKKGSHEIECYYGLNGTHFQETKMASGAMPTRAFFIFDQARADRMLAKREETKPLPLKIQNFSPKTASPLETSVTLSCPGVPEKLGLSITLGPLKYTKETILVSYLLRSEFGAPKKGTLIMDWDQEENFGSTHDSGLITQFFKDLESGNWLQVVFSDAATQQKIKGTIFDYRVSEGSNLGNYSYRGLGWEFHCKKLTPGLFE